MFNVNVNGTVFSSQLEFLRLCDPSWLYFFFNGHAIANSRQYEQLNYSPNYYVWLTVSHTSHMFQLKGQDLQMIIDTFKLAHNENTEF